MASNLSRLRTVGLTLAAVLFAFVGAAKAEPPRPRLAHNVNSVWFDNWIGLSNGMLRVAAPDGTIETIYEDSRAPVFRLSGARILDGRYRFELRAATEEHISNTRDPVFPGGDEDRPDTRPKPFYMTGGFLVERGRIVVPESAEEERKSR